MGEKTQYDGRERGDKVASLTRAKDPFSKIQQCSICNASRNDTRITFVFYWLTSYAFKINSEKIISYHCLLSTYIILSDIGCSPARRTFCSTTFVTFVKRFDCMRAQFSILSVCKSLAIYNIDNIFVFNNSFFSDDGKVGYVFC